MTSVQIKNVPDDVHATLRRRAAACGQSLQEYLLGRLSEDARRPSVEEVLARAGGLSGGATSFTDAATIIRSGRDAR